MGELMVATRRTRSNGGVSPVISTNIHRNPISERPLLLIYPWQIKQPLVCRRSVILTLRLLAILFLVGLLSHISELPPLFPSVLVGRIRGNKTGGINLRLIQVQVIHRHGDRTPITPLIDSAYWSTLLPTADVLSEMSSLTRIKRNPGPQHAAGGGTVFGRLTSDGLRQMIDVGATLRSDVELMSGVGGGVVDVGDPSAWLTVSTTDFSRTVQSVQGVLHGLLIGNSTDDTAGMGDGGGRSVRVDVDATHTDKMIPDPQPRLYVGQTELEQDLQRGTGFAKREAEMRPLAVRVTESLRSAGLIGAEAEKTWFGVGEDGKGQGSESDPLSWNQLAEILKCLERRNRLPDSITASDLEAVSRHNAGRWFSLLNDRTLVKMTAKSLVKKLVRNAGDAKDARRGALRNAEQRRSSMLHIFSGHDSTLIMLMCAFRLERPEVWPEYGSYLKLELLCDDGENGGTIEDGRSFLAREGRRLCFVRFSLNGVTLRSRFGDRAWVSSSRPRELIPWEEMERGMEELESGMPPLLTNSRI